jgi:hypothetical protein
MIDILFLTRNRKEFTQASLAALIKNTAWRDVRSLILYDDQSEDGTREYLKGVNYPCAVEFRYGEYGSPVAVMNHYLTGIDATDQRIFAKIDNDTMVPPRWLPDCLQVSHAHPPLSLLGIEAMYPIQPSGFPRDYAPAEFIGGIGLMRAHHFVTLPRPSGRFGFTAYQTKTAGVTAGWINPSIQVFLLDRIPREPWRTLAREYTAKGWQRPWPPYGEESKQMWEWWTA